MYRGDCEFLVSMRNGKVTIKKALVNPVKSTDYLKHTFATAGFMQ